MMFLNASIVLFKGFFSYLLAPGGGGVGGGVIWVICAGLAMKFVHSTHPPTTCATK